MMRQTLLRKHEDIYIYIYAFYTTCRDEQLTDRVPCVTETNNKVCISRTFPAEFYQMCSPYNVVGIFVRII